MKKKQNTFGRILSLAVPTEKYVSIMGKWLVHFVKKRDPENYFFLKYKKKGTLFVTMGRERIFALSSGQWAIYTVMAPLVLNASPGTVALSSCSSGLTPETNEPQLRRWLMLFTELDKQLAWSIGYSKISWPKHPAKPVQGLPLQAPAWTTGAEGAHEWIQRFSCASDQGSHCFPPTIWHASPHFSENLLFLHTIAFSFPLHSPYGYKWDQGGEHYMLSNGLPCIWKAKTRGLYNQANMQTNWNYNGTLEYIPEVFKPQRRKKSPPLNYKGLTETHKNWETQ